MRMLPKSQLRPYSTLGLRELDLEFARELVLEELAEDRLAEHHEQLVNALPRPRRALQEHDLLVLRAASATRFRCAPTAIGVGRECTAVDRGMRAATTRAGRGAPAPAASPRGTGPLAVTFPV